MAKKTAADKAAEKADRAENRAAERADRASEARGRGKGHSPREDNFVRTTEQLPTEADTNDEGELWIARGQGEPELTTLEFVLSKKHVPNHFWAPFDAYTPPEPEPEEPEEPKEPEEPREPEEPTP